MKVDVRIKQRTRDKEEEGVQRDAKGKKEMREGDLKCCEDVQ